MSSKIQAKKSFILILYGYPGSGKSTFARQLAGEIQSTIHLNMDKLYAELSKEFRSKNITDPAIYSGLMEYMAKEFIESGFNVVLDLPVYKRSDRRKITQLARQANAKLIMAWLQIDAESAFDRLKKRDKRRTNDKYARNYTRAEFESIINTTQNPTGEDYVVISGKHTFNTQKLAVFKKMRDGGILSLDQTVNKKIKPELVNLIPQSFRGRDEIRRRDISIR